MSETWIPFAIVARAHGVRGELLVKLFDDESGWPDNTHSVRLVPKHGEPRTLAVTSVRAVNRGVLICAAEIADRDQAQALNGATLYIDQASLTRPEDGEFYVFELEGAHVFDENERELGVVSGFFNVGEHTVIDVQGTDGAGLIPVSPQHIVHFDRAKKTIVVRGHEGLWETR